jgi:histone acetyltransferase 1
MKTRHSDPSVKAFLVIVNRKKNWRSCRYVHFFGGKKTIDQHTSSSLQTIIPFKVMNHHQDMINSMKRKRELGEEIDSQIRKEIKQGNLRNILTEESGRTMNSDEEASLVPRKLGNGSSNNSGSGDEYTTDSNEAIHLKLVRTAQDISNEDTTFYPTYTYQLFGEDEKIIGYKNLKIELYYVASTLYTYLRMSYDSKIGQPLDPIHVLTREKKIWGDVDTYPIAHEFTPHLEEFVQHINDPFTPPGDQFTGYSKGDSSFEVYRGSTSNPKVKSYHERLRTFCLFFVDGASYIDDEDSKWQIFMLFEKYKTETNQSRYAIIGYTTVYPFYAYPDKLRLRISQFIILPPFQKQGHGSKLLDAVYTSAQSNESVVEVCVEDPSDQFQSLRDVSDYKNFRAVYPDLNKLPKHWTDEFGKEVQKKLKITKDQIRKCYETAILEKLKFSNATKEDLVEYRLDVKRRLFKTYDIDKSISDPDERKEKLHEMYNELEEEYLDIITKVNHDGEY